MRVTGEASIVGEMRRIFFFVASVTRDVPTGNAAIRMTDAVDGWTHDEAKEVAWFSRRRPTMRALCSGHGVGSR